MIPRDTSLVLQLERKSREPESALLLLLSRFRRSACPVLRRRLFPIPPPRCRGSRRKWSGCREGRRGGCEGSGGRDGLSDGRSSAARNRDHLLLMRWWWLWCSHRSVRRHASQGAGEGRGTGTRGRTDEGDSTVESGGREAGHGGRVNREAGEQQRAKEQQRTLRRRRERDRQQGVMMRRRGGKDKGGRRGETVETRRSSEEESSTRRAENKQTR